MKLEHLTTSDQKLAGLQFRKKLDDNTVLVFWDAKEDDVFHTINCKFSFDIAFLGKKNTILGMKLLNPLKKESIKAPCDTVMVLEANRGFLRDAYSVGKRFHLNK